MLPENGFVSEVGLLQGHSIQHERLFVPVNFSTNYYYYPIVSRGLRYIRRRAPIGYS